MITQRLDLVRLVQHHQVRRRANGQAKSVKIDRLGRLDRDHVVELGDLLAGHHPEQVRSEKGHFQHVVAAEG